VVSGEWLVVNGEWLSSLGSSTPTTPPHDTCKLGAATSPVFVSCLCSYPCADCQHGLGSWLGFQARDRRRRGRSELEGSDQHHVNVVGSLIAIKDDGDSAPSRVSDEIWVNHWDFLAIGQTDGKRSEGRGVNHVVQVFGSNRITFLPTRLGASWPVVNRKRLISVRVTTVGNR
jgi:hypothetical protein